MNRPPGLQVMGEGITEEKLPPIPWSRKTALDPKHRPQIPERPSSTIRREWARSPQEAHLLDGTRERIRRLRSREIQILQGFDPGWFEVPGVSEADAVRAAGDAVPPPVSAVVAGSLNLEMGGSGGHFVEICAGAGGLASGLAAAGFEAEVLVERWPIAARILKRGKPWPGERVRIKDVRASDFSSLRGRVDVLSGGPPCQPWSTGGQGRGSADERDLLGTIDGLLRVLEPRAFVLENVPGLLSPAFESYLFWLFERLKHPSGSLRYGVMAGVLDAADYGVPQTRRRLFIIGLKGAPSVKAAAVLDRVEEAATTRHTTRPVVGDVIDVENGKDDWMAWPYGAPPSVHTR